MTVNDQNDFGGLMRIGRIVGLTIKTMAEALRPGMTTAELDAIGAAYEVAGAQSAPPVGAASSPARPASALMKKSRTASPGIA
ncbi:MAG: hypothetical protein IPK17_21950 [Chloroflexi bacterium]|uniref:hypothetical protein n=1 Tax=Candidatus Flexifilum breve TaxID=3140694 RepID=UPI003134CC99|nr:hypothetical protein [Chloroflexota bacterium]